MRENPNQGSGDLEDERKPANSRLPVRRRKSKGREWAEALLFALFAALVIRAFFFEAFRIPTPSMEKSLMIGDFLLVSKLHYGARTPITLGIPFTEIYSQDFKLPYTRLPGFSSVRRGDVVVFNYPVEEKPLDRKMHYVKRIVAVPGDTLLIRNKIVYTNNEPRPLREGMQQEWIVHKQDQASLPAARLRAMGVSELSYMHNPNEVRVQATSEAAAEIASWPYVMSVEPFVLPNDPRYGFNIFPAESNFNRDNYGPLFIPGKGHTIPLNQETWPAYQEVISRFEGRRVEQVAGGSFEVDGAPADQYTFTQNYYFVMGDNRDDSLDSRFWGFVPQNHVVGKAMLIYFSWEAERNAPRFSRMFSRIR